MPFSRIASHDDFRNEIIFKNFLSETSLENIDCFSDDFLSLVNESICSLISSEKIKLWIRWLLLQWNEEYFWAIWICELFCLKIELIIFSFFHSVASHDFLESHKSRLSQVFPLFSSNEPDDSWKWNTCQIDEFTNSPCLSRSSSTSEKNFENESIIECLEELSLFFREFYFQWRHWVFNNSNLWIEPWCSRDFLFLPVHTT